jgi:hypothetical protein
MEGLSRGSSISAGEKDSTSALLADAALQPGGENKQARIPRIKYDLLLTLDSRWSKSSGRRDRTNILTPFRWEKLEITGRWVFSSFRYPEETAKSPALE